jgi:bifunctional DNA-binding transcriptional regulator/antitoxin component of YhaV-PrlF toxin-antitoxin module
MAAALSLKERALPEKFNFSYYPRVAFWDRFQMPLIRVRKAGQVTLPLAMSRALDLKECDYLDAMVAEGSIILKPMAVFAREPGWREKITKDAPQRSKGGKQRK